MADLLECLIQIKGVAGTPARLAARVRACVAEGREGEARAVAARLAAADDRFAACLRAMLALDRPRVASLALGPLDVDCAIPLSESLDHFTARRRQVVAILDGCSAEDLNRVGVEPSRGPMTVADVVAVMLAHDTDQLGRLVSPNTPQFA